MVTIAISLVTTRKPKSELVGLVKGLSDDNYDAHLPFRQRPEFYALKCGIMDRYINIFGETGRVLKIDCRSLEYEYVPFEFPNVSLVLFDTGVSHSLGACPRIGFSGNYLYNPP